MPNRVIKESIKRSPQIDSLTWFEEVVFCRLIVTVDDYGCTDGRPVVLKSDLFPTKETVTKKSVDDAIQKLCDLGLVCMYESDGVPYLYMPSWEKHQRIRNKHRKYPKPPDDGQLSANCCQMTADCLSESNPNPNPIRIQSEAETRTREGDSGGLLTESEMQSLADGIHTALDAAKRAGFPDTQSDWDKCNGLVAEYGADAVLKAIETCTDYTMDKRNWRYLRGILKSDPTGGAKQKQTDKPKDKGYYNPFVDLAYAEMEKEHEQG